MDVLRFIRATFQPTLDALFAPGLPFTYRWRLVPLNMVISLTIAMKYLPWIFSRAYTIHMIPIRAGQKLRCIVFQPPRSPTNPDKLRPLHLSIHGGAFLGGIAEFNAEWASQISQKTGAVVVCSTYRGAPRYTYPCAHSDTDDVVQYLLQNAERLWQANPQLLTISGLSAGGNLAMATAQQDDTRPGSETSIKASVTFYAPIDLRLSPSQKPKPPSFPKKGPAELFFPLFDAYASPARVQHMESPRMNPCIASLNIFPENMLLIIPTIDILVHEQLITVERLKRELPEGSERRIETLVCEGCFHGWVELPSFAISTKMRRMKVKAFESGIAFLRDLHRKHGWEWNNAS